MVKRYMNWCLLSHGHELVHEPVGTWVKYEDYEDLKWKLADAEGAIAAHNSECESLCGVGELEGVRCGYRKYFPRRCSECPRNWMIERSPPKPSPANSENT